MNNDGKKMTSRVRTGVKGLDYVLGGGFPANKLYLMQGDPGSGKTTLALQFLMEGARAGEPVLYITLSESKIDLAGIAESHDWSLDGVSIHEVKQPADEAEDSADYTVFHPGEVELNDLMKDFFSEAERVRPLRAVIDSLSEMRLLARDPLKYRRHLLAIRHFFSSRGCTVLLLDAGKQKGDDLQANTLPHGVISLEHASPDFGARRRRLIVTKMRGVKFDDGYHDIKIEHGGVSVFPRLIAADHPAPYDRERISSNIAALDRLSGSGLQRGTSTVVMGPAGVGKSTLACQFVAAAASRGERAAFFSFDETIHTFLDRCSGYGMPMENYQSQGNLAVHSVDPGELSPGEFAHLVRKHVEEFGAKVVVIDSLNGYLQATPDERFLIVQLHELLTYLAVRGVVTMLVVAQHGLLGSQMDTAVDVSYLADTVFLLRYFESEGEVRKCISVLKNRTGAHESTIRELRVDSSGLQVGGPLKGFHGVLTGVPTFDGPTPGLAGGEAHGR
ncbi:MAG: kaiC [Mycobacterium sp.]|nr:kaiC [Mycobacterium sp.]